MDDLERSRIVLQIAREALDVEVEKRVHWIDARCGEDHALRDSVLGLLDAVQQDPTLSMPPKGETKTSPGSVIGEFELRDRVGEGAFGEVFLAERREPFAQRVALKILKHGMNTREILARFAMERELLARMDHESVARVITGGRTADGRPWFAMEYVPGDPITKHCDDARLEIRKRVELFAEVCEGVQHAHQKGAIHRDIKPANILVKWHEGVAVAKVIDFGIAKVLDPGRRDFTLATDLRGIVGTPSYMAPEQWGDGAQDVDTRTDIYALGVVLYELLTGVLPFDLRGAPLETVRATVLAGDPPRPSAKLASLAPQAATRIAEARRTTPQGLARLLARDLDWIVLRCLDRDRGRRYASAAALAADLGRFLRGETVEAAPPSVSYRLGKLARRRWRELSTGIAIAILLGTATWFGMRWWPLQRKAHEDRAHALVAEADLLAFRYPAQALAKVAQARALAGSLNEVDLAEAYALAMGGQRDQARAVAEAALRRAPGSGEAMAILAGLLRDTDPARAHELDGKARALLPRERRHLLALGIREDRVAVDALTESIAVYPWNFDACFQRALRRYALDDYEGALEEAELLLKIRPDLDLVWNLVGAATFARNPDPAPALYYYDRAIAMPPARALKLVNRSMALVAGAAPRLADALRDADEAVRLEPTDLEAWGQRCDVLFRLERWKDAESCFADALGLASCNAKLLRGRARTRRNAGELAGALADYTAALDCPGSLPAAERAELLDLRGEIQRYLGRYQEAFEDSRRAFELDGKRAEAASDAGWALLFLQRNAEARTWLDRPLMLPSDSTSPEWVVRRGYAALLAGDTRTAIRDFDFAAATTGAEFLGVLGWEARMRAGLRGEAARALQALVSRPIDRSDASAEINRSALRYLMTAEEEGTFLDAAKADEDRVTAYYVLGAHAAALGNPAEAQRWFARGAAMAPTIGLEVELARLRLAASP